MTGTVAVLARTGDAVAHALVAGWPGGRARLLTPALLPAWGLAWSLDAGGMASWDADPGQRGVAGIDGVVGLLGAVQPADLPLVAPADREYVAAEMTAFLSAWLHTLDCPKLNPPSLVSLCGDLHPVLWRAHAHGCGMVVPAWDAAQPVMASHHPAVHRVAITLVGDRVIGSGDAALVACARALAAAARLPMLSVALARTSGGVAFEAATAMPDLSDPAIAEAVMACLSAPAR